MKKLIASLAFIIVGLFIVDRIGGAIMWQVNQHTEDISGPKIRYMVNDVDEDVVCMGTSRCNMHYVPSIISDTLGMTVYNGGVDASGNIYSHYILLGYMLKHHSPKVIVLDVRAGDFSGTGGFNTIGYFAPYFGLCESSDSVYREAGKYWLLKASHLYRYNSKAPSNILGLFVDKNTKEDHGYRPSPRPKFHPTKLTTKTTPPASDKLAVEYLNRFIYQCQSHGVQLVFSISPCYRIVDSSYYQPLYEIAKDNGIPVLDYHSKGMFIDNPNCFKDEVHLWDSSARIFSSEFAHDIKPYISKLQ